MRSGWSQQLYNVSQWSWIGGEFSWADPSSLLYYTLNQEASGMLQERREHLNSLKTAADWEKRREEVLGQFSKAVGPIPTNRTALNTKTLRTYECADGVMVKLLVYESRPRFYVSAGLYFPSGATPSSNLPGILFSSGHTSQAFRADATNSDDSYQIVVNNLVRRGFVVLAIDPPSQGERIMYPTGNGTSAVGGCSWNVTTGQTIGGSCTTEHNYYGRQSAMVGVSAASIWLWDLMRGVDVLSSTPGVDASRIGAAGCSGGGTQTAYISAMDERVQAASIACYMGTFEVDFAYQGSADAEQQWIGGVADMLDKADLLVARAPKATQALLTTDDTCFPPQGGRAAVDDARRAFDALGAPENLTKHEAVWHHGYVQPNREALYGFFIEKLGGSGNSTELPIPPIPPENLTATYPIGNVNLFFEDALPIPALIAQWVEEKQSVLNKRRNSDTNAFLADIRANVGSLAGVHPPTPGLSSLRSVWLGTVTNGTIGSVQNVTITKQIARTEGVCLTPTISYSTPSTTTTTIVLVSAASDSSPTPFYTSLMEQGLNAGFRMVSINPCGFGEAGYAFKGNPHGNINSDHNPTGIARFLNRTLPGLHAGDILAGMEVAGVEGDVVVVGIDHLSPALCIALLTTPTQVPWEAKGLVRVGEAVGWGDVASSQFYDIPEYFDFTNALSYFDLPDIQAALNLPQTVLLPTSPTLTPLNQTEADSAFFFPISTLGPKFTVNASKVLTNPTIQAQNTIAFAQST